MPPYVKCGISGVVVKGNCFGLSLESHTALIITHKKE
jgi:hypothetical protein